MSSRSKFVGTLIDRFLHLLGEFNGLSPRLLQFFVDARAHELGGFFVVIDDRSSAHRSGIGDGLLEDCRGGIDPFAIKRVKSRSVRDVSQVFGVATVQLSVDGLYAIRIRFDDQLIQVESVTHRERAGCISVVKGFDLVEDQLGV